MGIIVTALLLGLVVGFITFIHEEWKMWQLSKARLQSYKEDYDLPDYDK